MKEDVVIKVTDKKGQGLFANREFKKGDVVVCGKLIKKVSKRTNYSFQLGPNFHVQLDKIARSINHSCEPNCGIRNNFYGGYDFIALKTIQKGEEITWDYATSEYISISINKCNCESKNCREIISGYSGLSNEIRLSYLPYIADYLKMFE